MVSITMDHSAMIIFRRHAGIDRLAQLEKEGNGKLRIFHAHNLGRDLASMSQTEQKIYDALRIMVFSKAQQELSLTDHADLVLLVNHMKNKRDYFLTMDQAKYATLEGHRNIDVRFPDKKFLKEVEIRLGIVADAGKTAKKRVKIAKPHAKNQMKKGKK